MMPQDNLIEVQMDTLVGMTHHFGGHAKGNFASMHHKGQNSNPKQAALQGLEKMKWVLDQGVPQLVLPPQSRPHLPSLRTLGLNGSIQTQLQKLFEINPNTFAKLCSSAFIWTANAATVIPSCDTLDHKVHLYIANLNSHLHREIESQHRLKLFREIFPHPSVFSIHPPLPSSELRDEGAANHTRFEGGYHLFVYGDPTGSTPGFENIPRRQSLAAQKIIAHSAGLHHDKVLYLQQSDQALKAGVFHNDVAAVGFEHTYLCHEQAYHGGLNDLEKLQTWYNINHDHSLNLEMVSKQDLSLDDTVASYLFNTQWLSLKNHTVKVLTPTQCQQNAHASNAIDQWMHTHQNWTFEYINLNESMNNGGGPACLRLRLPLTQNELEHVHPGVFLTQKKYEVIRQWIETYYPSHFSLSDVLDPEFRQRQKNALQALYYHLDLPLDLIEKDHDSL